MSDQQIPYPLEPSEQVIASGQTRYLRSTPTNLGYNPVDGALWVTSHRIIFKPDYNPGMRKVYRMVGAMTPAQFPVRRVTDYETINKRVQWQDLQVLKLIFDNGGREYFAVQDPPRWGLAILSARDKAPEMAYSDVPRTTSGVEASQSRTILIVLGALFGAVALCCGIAVLAGMLVDK